MPSRPVSPPYTIDRAVEDEQEFWGQIRGMLREEIEAATADATLAMKTVSANQSTVVERLNALASQQAVTNAGVVRIENMLTAKMLADGRLKERIERLIFALDPSSVRPTPPAGVKENGGHD